MSSKKETYRVTLSSSNPEIIQLIQALNQVFSRLENRLDEMEAVRGTQHTTTSDWENKEIKED